MKKTKFLTFCFLIILLFTECKNSDKFKYEDLLFIYLEEYQQIKENNYYLLTVSSNNNCESCSLANFESFEHILKKDLKLNLYVISDDTDFLNRITQNFSKEYSFTVLCEENEILLKHGLYLVHPHLFEINNKSIVNWEFIR